jgi:hypothetical protein
MSHNIRVPKGADYIQQCKWLKLDGTAVNLTGITLSCVVKSYPTRATANVTPTVAVVSAAAGTFKVTFTDTQTATMVKDDYVWDVLATEPLGSISRIISGRVIVYETGEDIPLPPNLQTAVQDPLE